MKKNLIILGMTIILALVIIISIRLSDEAIAVILGVGLGILASIPTSLLLFFLLTRQDSPSAKTPSHQPPVVIVNGQQPGVQAGTPPPSAYQMQVPSTRTFTVVGDDDTTNV